MVDIITLYIDMPYSVIWNISPCSLGDLSLILQHEKPSSARSTATTKTTGGGKGGKNLTTADKSAKKDEVRSRIAILIN